MLFRSVPVEELYAYWPAGILLSRFHLTGRMYSQSDPVHHLKALLIIPWCHKMTGIWFPKANTADQGP